MSSGPKPKLRVSFVVPRYGLEIIGGAENATRMLAEALVAQNSAQVEILTTTAMAIDTWENAYPASNEVLNGVTVKRFAVTSGRTPNFSQATKRTLASPRSQSVGEATEFIRLQGPVSDGLTNAVELCESDALVFYPYLYHPTVEGILRGRLPTIMHPAAHQEPVLNLPIFESVFQKVSAVVYHTEAERDLIESHFQVAHKPSLDLGMGFRQFNGIPGDIVTRLGLSRDRYLLCLGRVDAPKGTTLLVNMFNEFKNRNESDLKLVLAGPVSILPNVVDDVLVLGPISEADKAALLSGAIALISPSAFESFSIVLIEAWSYRKPVLVNAACLPTVEQARNSGGGLIFSGYESFEVAIRRIQSDPSLNTFLGNAGYNYVMSRYQWPQLIERYTKFIQKVVDNHSKS